MEQTVFLQTIATALGRQEPLTSRPARQEVGPPAFWKELTWEQPNLPDLFKTNLEALTGRVVFAASPAEVTRQISTWLEEINAQSVILWKHGELQHYVDTAALNQQITLWDNTLPRHELLASAERADAGITWANYAVAYTGSLALFNSPTQGRSVSLLPATHIAVFKKSAIVPTMSSVIRHLTERCSQGELPSVVDFITGPSRTSDIEMDLSIGVHGPFRVWTIVIND